MKTERLYGITIYLLNHGRVSANALAKEFEVSKRTIQRDIDCLSMASIPVISFTGVDGGYELQESFKMKAQLATSQDYTFITTALKGLQTAFDKPELRLTLEKVNAVSNPKHQEDMILDFSVLHENPHIQKQLKQLEELANTHHIMTFQYVDSYNHVTARKVDVITLLYKWYSWYCISYDLDKKAYRMFKVIRMQNLKHTSETTTVSHPTTQSILMKLDQSSNQTKIHVKLYVKACVKMKVYEYLQATTLDTMANGDVIVAFTHPQQEPFWLPPCYLLVQM